jgi:hypothetical protein
VKKTDNKVMPLWEESPVFEEKDILTDRVSGRGSLLFLGRFSLKEVQAVLGKRNFFREAKTRDLIPLEFRLDASEHPLQRFQIFHRAAVPENLIVDLKIREMEYIPRPLPGAPVLLPQKCLALEWLTLQNPRLSFCERKAPLPGQQHPGLGMGRKVVEVFAYLGKVTDKDGILAYPAYFHNAVLFSRFFRFYNPVKEGEIAAIRRRFRKISLKQLAWIVHLNCLRRQDGSVYEWAAEEQVYALRRPFKAYFDSRAYRDRVKAVERESVFTVDEAALESRLDRIPALCRPIEI